MKMLIAGSV
jgi:putative ABC transport system ATP-binding protein